MNDTYTHPQTKLYITIISFLNARVVQALIVMILLLAIVDNYQLLPSITFTLNALWDILPFFVLALLLAAYTQAAGVDEIIATLFEKQPITAIFLASIFGALSPFCSCGVIPIIAALLAARVPLAPVMAFCIASPIMDPEIFVLTAAGINLEFAIAKTIAAIAMGLFTGFTVLSLSFIKSFKSPLKVTQHSSCSASSCNEQKKTTRWLFWYEQKRRVIFQQQFLSNSFFLGKWLSAAFFIESFMLTYIPQELVASTLGGESWSVIPLAALVGVPAYLNGYAAVPLVNGLLNMGMSPGAAMAFITAGAVSSIPAAMAVFALVRMPVFLVYLTLGFSGSIAVGFAYQWFVLST